MYRFMTTLTIFALILGSQAAHAADVQPAPCAVVRFADLDLSHSSSVAVLYHRLKVAAAGVCFPLYDRALARQMIFNACVQNAISTAVTKAHQPALTAYYEATTNDRNGASRIAQNR